MLFWRGGAIENGHFAVSAVSIFYLFDFDRGEDVAAHIGWSFVLVKQRRFAMRA